MNTPIPYGTIARPAFQCDHPSGKTGSFLFVADNHKDDANVVTDCFDGFYELSRFIIESPLWEVWPYNGYRYLGTMEQSKSLRSK